MKDCLNDETLQTWLDGELAPDAANDVETHVANCESCAANVQAARHALSLVDSGWNAELPSSVPAITPRTPILRSGFGGVRIWGVAAAVVVLALGVTIVLRNRPVATPEVRVPRRNASVDVETSRHLEQTQNVLRSIRNAESKNLDDLVYDIELSKELLSHNRLLRRRAVQKEDSQAERMLSHVEPILLDIANLSEPPFPDDIDTLKKRIHDQSFITELQLYASRAAACSKSLRTPCL
jgi:hypothetical protein